MAVTKAFTFKADKPEKKAIAEFILDLYQNPDNNMTQLEAFTALVEAYKRKVACDAFFESMDQLRGTYCKDGESLADCLVRLQADSDSLVSLQLASKNGENPLLDLTSANLLASKPKFSIDEIRNVIAQEPTNSDDQFDFDMAKKFIVIYNYCKSKDETITAEDVVTLCIDAFYDEIIESKKEAKV